MKKLEIICSMEERKKNLKKAAVQSFNDIKMFGISKHETREAFNRGIREKAADRGISEEAIAALGWLQSPFIHGISTFNQYVYIAFQYIDWLAENHPEVDRLKYAHQKEYDREFIQRMIDLGYAPSSINRATCALAKLYRCHSNDIHDNRPLRSYVDFMRSRGYTLEQFEKDREKYGTIVDICRFTGVRELELENLYPECFKLDKNGNLYLHLDGKKQNTKTAKTRDVVILAKNQECMKEILAALTPGEKICPVAPSHLDIHGIRSMYATDYYNEIARNPADIPKSERLPLKREKKDKSRPHQKRIDAPAVYTRKHDGKRFDRVALLVVSRSLGHNREDVMIASYIR